MCEKREWESIIILYNSGLREEILREDLDAIKKILPVLEAFDEAQRIYKRLGELLNSSKGGT